MSLGMNDVGKFYMILIDFIFTHACQAKTLAIPSYRLVKESRLLLLLEVLKRVYNRNLVLLI